MRRTKTPLDKSYDWFDGIVTWAEMVIEKTLDWAWPGHIYGLLPWIIMTPLLVFLIIIPSFFGMVISIVLATIFPGKSCNASHKP